LGVENNTNLPTCGLFQWSQSSSNHPSIHYRFILARSLFEERAQGILVDFGEFEVVENS